MLDEVCPCCPFEVWQSAHCVYLPYRTACISSLPPPPSCKLTEMWHFYAPFATMVVDCPSGRPRRFWRTGLQHVYEAVLNWKTQQQADATQPVSLANSERVHALWRAVKSKLTKITINYIAMHVGMQCWFALSRPASSTPLVWRCLQQGH